MIKYMMEEVKVDPYLMKSGHTAFLISAFAGKV